MPISYRKEEKKQVPIAKAKLSMGASRISEHVADKSKKIIISFLTFLEPMDIDTVIRSSFFLLPAFAIFLSLFVFIPITFEYFTKWKEKDKSVYFSGFVISVFASLSLLLFSFIVFLRIGLHFQQHFTNEVVKFLLGLALIFLTSFAFIPQSLQFFRKWKNTNQTIYLSMLLLSGFLSLYSLSMVFLKLVISSI